jgi:hypothetical protein
MNVVFDGLATCSRFPLAMSNLLVRKVQREGLRWCDSFVMMISKGATTRFLRLEGLLQVVNKTSALKGAIVLCALADNLPVHFHSLRATFRVIPA